MPFVEIEPEISPRIIHIRRRKDRDFCLTISYVLREIYFKKPRVKIFVDKENNLLGLMPTDEPNAYKLSEKMHVVKLNPYPIKSGIYKAEWSIKHKMLIAEIEFDE